MHGGKSTGPRTAAWLERSRRARWRHGHYSAEAKAERGLSEVVKIVIHVSIETSVEFLLKALRIQPTRVISIHGQPAAGPMDKPPLGPMDWHPPGPMES